MRQGDLYALPVELDFYDLVVMHQVLHYLDDPLRAIREATRALRPGGRLLIVDFAPHEEESLRLAHAHRRLGFSTEEVAGYLAAAGLDVVMRRELAPQSGECGKLTVTIWLGRDRRINCGRPSSDSARSRMSENPSCELPRASRTLPADIRVSFEFFPPKTVAMEAMLWESINRLAPLGPSFMSVTYGAGGSTRERTHATVARLAKEGVVKPAAHLTCVDAARGEIDAIVQGYWEAGVRHIVALRGDPREGLGAKFCPHPDGYESSCALVAGIKRIADFEISVSAYPERHPESLSLDADIDFLRAKVDAGANRAITQFFFENEIYLNYLEKLRARGIDIPVVPGIMPMQNFKQTAGFAKKAGASVPQWLADRFEGLDDDPQTRRLVAATVAAEQVLDLVDHGVRDFHFYTNNRADLVYAICHLLGLRPKLELKAAE